MTESFNAKVLGIPVIIEIDEMGHIISVKAQKEWKLELDNSMLCSLEDEYAETISQILEEVAKEAQEAEDHVNAIRDCGRYL